MKRQKELDQKTVDSHLGLFRSLSEQELADAEARASRRFRDAPAQSATTASVEETASGRSAWGWRLGFIGVAAAIVLAIFLWTPASIDAPAVFETATGSRKIEFGEVVRSGDVAGSALLLADSSRVEMRAKSELLLERAHDGVRIRLSKGSVLVTAAKQHNGHLYVQTKDVTVSVIGTVFLVNAEEEGSRVAVIEGEVRVKQGATETSLRSGEQVATNPKMEAPLVSKELEWSPKAETQLATLQQQGGPTAETLQALQPLMDALQRVANPSSIVPATRQEKFEVASIRFKPSVDGGRGNGPLGNACGNAMLKIQIDPRRISISAFSLNDLIVLAYPEWAEPRGGCRGVSSVGLLSGGLGWVRSDLWDIEATIPEGPVEYKATSIGSIPGVGRRGQALPAVTVVEDLGPRVRGMLQNLLADRFHLVLRPETKDMPVYLLTVGKNGFKSNGVNGQTNTMVLRREDYISINFSKVSMPKIATRLASNADRPVLDRTNLAGTFDFHLDYDPVGTSERPSLFQAIEEVGLKLEPSRAPVEVWVIERADKPTEN